ncbi:MAG: amidohydrolase family protein [Vicinamibacterales bacterium]
MPTTTPCRPAHSRRWQGLVAAAVTSLALAQPPAPGAAVVVRGGTVVDGGGLPPFRADVAISDGAIVAVGDLDAWRGTTEIDARGLYVAPGFVNIHSHATADGLTTAVNMLTQGVTTEIVNADGGGPLDLTAQLADLERRGLAVNVGANIGFNSAWREVVGLADRRPSAAEVTRMRALVTAGLAAGAWGVSAGLDYKPAYYAATEDVVAVVSAARDWRTVFTSHDRLTPESGFSSQAAMAETLAIGARSGTAPLITHMKAQGHEQGTVEVTLTRMREASARGVHAAADVYPYLAGQTALVAFTIPGWAQDGGRDAMLARFADPVQRARIVAEAESAMQARFGGPSGIYLPSLRQELTAVMQARQVGAGEAVVRLLEEGDPGIIARFGSEADLVAILRHPAASVACDCGAVGGEAAHPRYYGTFPRVLGRYVREQGVLSWADAVRKMSGLPAATIGLVDRGRVAVGMAADVVVFDPAVVADLATFDAPTRRSVGVRHVIVNGRIALADGAPTGIRAGATLRRTRHMPARPMNGDRPRRLVVRADAADGALDIELRQPAGAARAEGRLHVSRPDGGLVVEFVEFGPLQTAAGWAAVTGMARVAGDRQLRPAVAIVDGDTTMVRAGAVEHRGRVRR